MLSLFRLSLEGMPFAIVLPWFWLAMLILAGVAAWTRRPAHDSVVGHRHLAELLLPFGFPIAIVLWAHMLRATLEGSRGGWHWQDLGVFALLSVQTLVGAWLLTRHRTRLQVALTVCALAGWWAAGASFVAGMAIHNDWL